MALLGKVCNEFRAVSQLIIHFFKWPIINCLLVLVTGYCISRIRRARFSYSDLPQPPHNAFLGHLIAMADVTRALPKDISPHIIFTQLQHKYNLGSLFTVDLRPFSPDKILVIADPLLAKKVTRAPLLPKHPVNTAIISHVVGQKSLILSEGREWYAMRSIFAPGFAASKIITLTSAVVDETLIFCNILRQHAQTGEVFRLWDATIALTIDVIGRAILDVTFNSQTTENEFVGSLRKLILSTPDFGSMNPFEKLNLIRPFIHWRHGRKVENYISKVIDERSRLATAKKTSKPVLDYALEENARNNQTIIPRHELKRVILDNMRSFIFAGHDTTASTLSYIYLMMERHPKALAKVQQEHDEVFSTDLHQTAQKIKEYPILLSRLPYTLAVIKEVLRLYPIGHPAKIVDEGYEIVHDDKKYTLKGTYLMMIATHTMGRSPELFPNPDEFIPERFLPGAPGVASTDAWRPFERGPRNCIGQELALLEMKIAMVLTLRTFNVMSAIEEQKTSLGDYMSTLNGDPVYQVQGIAAKPKDGSPTRVKERVFSVNK
ncbi:cytochrome P450 [Aspergillus granulosus]|uniref:Cytochrome P450 n=1 Tax=Aspergillus granulosus TaxID=176169 RepID=A0ABR4H4J3_9EURO